MKKYFPFHIQIWVLVFQDWEGSLHGVCLFSQVSASIILPGKGVQYESLRKPGLAWSYLFPMVTLDIQISLI